MSGMAWAIAALLLAGSAAVAAWPAGAVLRRLDAGQRNPSRFVTTADLRRLGSRIRALADGPPRRAVGAAVLTGAATGSIVAGPVAGLVFAAYGALGARAAVRRVGRRRAMTARSRSLDDLNALAADLRAGLTIGPLGAACPPIGPATATAATRPSTREDTAQRCSLGTADDDDAQPFSPGPSGARSSSSGTASRTDAALPFSPGGAARSPELLDPRLAELTAAVWRLAEQTGAPAADLVDRIEADARAADRSRATAAAQAAGARATALLLAALPIGGIALGYGIGVDPLRILLHTPSGAACAIGALLLQCGGLLWADRLSTGPTR